MNEQKKEIIRVLRARNIAPQTLNQLARGAVADLADGAGPDHLGPAGQGPGVHRGTGGVEAARLRDQRATGRDAPPENARRVVYGKDEYTGATFVPVCESGPSELAGDLEYLRFALNASQPRVLVDEKEK